MVDYNNVNAVILVFHGFAEYNGISKKIFSQCDALNKIGCRASVCHLNIDKEGIHTRMVGDRVVETFGKGFIAKFRKRYCYTGLYNYIIDSGVNFLYVRSAHNCNPFLLAFLKRVKRAGVKIVMEIPTYPYDNEYIDSGYRERLKLFTDQLYRKKLKKYLSWIITFTDYKEIFGVPTISISNGIDFSKIEIKKERVGDGEIRCLGVAEVHFWHGFDRMIEGLASYYRERRDTKVTFHIVGRSYGSEVDQLKSLAKDRGVEEYVFFYGALSGEALDNVFNECDFGIASLGRHRSNIIKIKTLKNREYAARGIPFIYSEIDEDFETMPYIIKALPDESPIDVEEIIHFYRDFRMSPEQIRGTISDSLSWSVQMKKVVDTNFD